MWSLLTVTYVHLRTDTSCVIFRWSNMFKPTTNEPRTCTCLHTPINQLSICTLIQLIHSIVPHSHFCLFPQFPCACLCGTISLARTNSSSFLSLSCLSLNILLHLPPFGFSHFLSPLCHFKVCIIILELFPICCLLFCILFCQLQKLTQTV